MYVWKKGHRKIWYIVETKSYGISAYDVWLPGIFDTFEEAVEAHRLDALT